MSVEQFRFSHRLRVRWGECDMQAIVFNANYLLYVDVAITEYWREFSAQYPKLNEEFLVHTYVVKSTLEFKGSARFDDFVDVYVRTEKLGNSSMVIAFEIHREEKDGTRCHLISCQNIYVYALDGKPASIPEKVRSLIQAYDKL